MERKVTDWALAADDVYTYLNERKRAFSVKKMLSLLDELAVRGSASQAEMMSNHGSLDFVATTIGHVTTAIHGKGSVPKPGGWYRITLNPHTYHVDAEFAEAWKRKRRLTDVPEPNPPSF